MSTPPDFTLPELSKWHRARLLQSATRVLEAQHHMTGKKGKNILHYTLQKSRRHTSYSHYPKGDRIDHATGAQYFYHCHREDLISEEHGHFHCFMRYKNIPKRIRHSYPADVASHTHPPMTHLVAIAMNRFGQPIRLFTVNQWVSSEIWYDARHVDYFVRRFKMTLDNDPYWQVMDQWVSGMIQLFAPQIHWLHMVRDQNIEQLRLKAPDENAFENREIEELSSIPLDFSRQIEWIIG
ncbi:DUF6969 family protein [Legionella sp. CNM-4043-24]|uniref:DUF6969 family protein n=1 Tax=Legionella sp. CNM-4043-24 TaxID=3421646 RepID=UPI00403B0EB2